MATVASRRAPAGPATSGSRRRPSATVLAALLVTAIFGVLAWQRLWISDDGLIVVRVIRQVLDGSGPNYNPFQRDEVNTSALWTWVGAAVALVLPGDEAVQLVLLGWVLSIAGLGLALTGAIRFHRARGADGPLLPAGALVVVAVAGFWDFATSGLESSLCLFWLGLLGALLATTSEQTGPIRLLGTAALLGLGPLVRPDLGLVTVVLGVALLALARPGRRRALGLVGAVAAVPVGYEIFRAGYYGILVPMPALAKEASQSLWGRGLVYLEDFVGVYHLFVPVAVLGGLAAWMLIRHPADRRTLVFFGAPPLCALLLGVYILRVGGDYMHARMWLPALFAALLPLMVVPVGRNRRVESAAVVVLAVWALLAGLFARTPYSGKTFGPNGIVNERSYEVAAFGVARPVTPNSRRPAVNLRRDVRKLTEGEDRPLILSQGPNANGELRTLPLSPDIPDSSAWSYSNMGIADYVARLETTVVDINGLASPLAGHLEINQPGRPGHEKWLPAAWVIAEYADPAAIATMPDHPDATRAQALAARRALGCGELKELMDSVDQPMSPSRFWANLTGSPARTSLRVPADPFVAEKRFCG